MGFFFQLIYSLYSSTKASAKHLETEHPKRHQIHFLKPKEVRLTSLSFFIYSPTTAVPLSSHIPMRERGRG